LEVLADPVASEVPVDLVASEVPVDLAASEVPVDLAALEVPVDLAALEVPVDLAALEVLDFNHHHVIHAPAMQNVKLKQEDKKFVIRMKRFSIKIVVLISNLNHFN
jgi:hypothetical protein